MLRGWSGGAAADRAARSGSARARPTSPPCCRSWASRRSRSAATRAWSAQRLFDALAALLAEIASGAPLLLVFDDLQWADGPTLQLLRHLLRAPQPRRTMFLGTYRDEGVDHPLGELIATLRREGDARRLPLDGLARGEVAELVAALGAPRRRRPSSTRCTTRPRATRSSSRRSCATPRHGGDLPRR